MNPSFALYNLFPACFRILRDKLLPIGQKIHKAYMFLPGRKKSWPNSMSDHEVVGHFVMPARKMTTSECKNWSKSMGFQWFSKVESRKFDFLCSNILFIIITTMWKPPHTSVHRRGFIWEKRWFPLDFLGICFVLHAGGQVLDGWSH